jgi:hypothetical protein
MTEEATLWRVLLSVHGQMIKWDEMAKSKFMNPPAQKFMISGLQRCSHYPFSLFPDHKS